MPVTIAFVPLFLFVHTCIYVYVVGNNTVCVNGPSVSRLRFLSYLVTQRRQNMQSRGCGALATEVQNMEDPQRATDSNGARTL